MKWGAKSTVLGVLDALEVAEEAFLKEEIRPNLCRERGSGIHPRYEKPHEQMLGLWGGGNSEVRASGPPLRQDTKGFPSLAGPG